MRLIPVLLQTCGRASLTRMWGTPKGAVQLRGQSSLSTLAIKYN